MSKIRELKTNPDNNLNLVTVLELFSPIGKSKYTDMLLKLMKNTPNLKQHTKEIKETLTKETLKNKERIINMFGSYKRSYDAEPFFTTL